MLTPKTTDKATLQAGLRKEITELYGKNFLTNPADLYKADSRVNKFIDALVDLLKKKRML